VLDSTSRGGLRTRLRVCYNNRNSKNTRENLNRDTKDALMVYAICIHNAPRDPGNPSTAILTLSIDALTGAALARPDPNPVALALAPAPGAAIQAALAQGVALLVVRDSQPMQVECHHPEFID
jgi:hypothetical protein